MANIASPSRIANNFERQEFMWISPWVRKSRVRTAPCYHFVFCADMNFGVA